MNEAISSMLSKYKCTNLESYESALKEIIQEIALLGLWRSKFFEKAAFYGGTALRILYGLDRFSEDLDFSLLVPDQSFNLTPYFEGIKSELESFGFQVNINRREKAVESAVESAFIKTGTLNNLVTIEAPDKLIKRIPSNRLIKIKLEIDIDPPGRFETEAKYLLEPIPFSVNTYKLPDLFAGKLHAVLCRKWKTRVKGRDWYDFVWFIGKGVPLHLSHLEERMKQSGDLKENDALTENVLFDLLRNKINNIDFKAAKKDVVNILKDPASTDVWSKEFFRNVILQIKL